MKRFAFAAMAALFITSVVPAQAADPGTVGRWSIASRADDQSRVSLRLEYAGSSGSDSWNSSWSSTVALAEAGIPADRLRGPIAPVTFSIQREPGNFACTGSAGEGSGAGQFTYAQNARFDDALASRGMGRPTLHESLELAIAGTTLAFIDRIRSTTQHAATADIVRVVQHGVSPRYVDGLAALGYKTSSLDELVRLADHGVRERFIADMRAAGYTKVTADQLVTFRDHGVTPRYVGELAAVGYKNFSAEEIVSLRDHGVSAAFVERLKAHGYNNLSVADLIRLRDAGI